MGRPGRRVERRHPLTPAVHATDATSEFLKAIQARDLKLVRELLRRHPEFVKLKDGDGNSALLIAAYANAPAIAETLLAAGAPVNVFEAAALGKADMVQALVGLERRLMRARSHDGWSLLHLGAFFGHAPLVRWLVKAGADLESVSANAMANRPLHSAVAGRRFEPAKALLQAGADVDAPAGGWTPLHLAAHAGHQPLCELLLAFGARTDVAGPDEKTAADLALAMGHAALAEHLKRF